MLDPNLQFFYITPNLQEAVNRLDETLVVMVTHRFDLLVMRFDPRIQTIKKLLWIWTIID